MQNLCTYDTCPLLLQLKRSFPGQLVRICHYEDMDDATGFIYFDTEHLRQRTVLVEDRSWFTVHLSQSGGLVLESVLPNDSYEEAHDFVRTIDWVQSGPCLSAAI